MRSYLKRFFDVAKKLSGIETLLFHNCDNLSWIVLISEESSKKKLGITNLGVGRQIEVDKYIKLFF